MKCLDRFNQRMSFSGGSIREEYIKEARENIHTFFADDPSYTPDIYLWEFGVDNLTPIPMRVYGRASSAAVGITVKFQTEYNQPVEIGDIFYMKKDDAYYICTEYQDIDGINYQGKLTLCNWMLKWQDETGQILEYPCYHINSTQYNSGETSNRIFTVGTSQYLITLPCDENTIKIQTPKRFLLTKNHVSPVTYIVTQNDTTSHNYGKKGLVKITVTQYEFNPKRDRVDLGICDYFTVDDVAPDIDYTDNIYSSIEYDTLKIKSYGDSVLFKSKFVNGKGEELEIEPKWTIICDFKEMLNIKEEKNGIRIGISNDDYIDEQFKLVLSDKNNNYSSEVLITIDSLL